MQYYIRYNNQTIGPMDAHQLASYGVTSDTQVSVDGGDWRPLYTYPELMELTSKANADKPQVESRRVACGVLAILIGWLGLQYFLVGKTAGGIITIALTLATCGLWSIITFIQGILMLCMSDAEWRAKFVDSSSTFPIF